MKSILTILLIVTFGNSFAQTDSAQLHVFDSAFYYNTDIHAAFPGGDNAWKRYLEANLEYPSNETRGDVVVQFLVSEKGKVDSAIVISGPPALHKEAIRLVKKLNWVPGIKNGRKVNSWTTVTISFK